MLSDDFQDFLNKLIYFGGNLGIQDPLKRYIDIEEFIADATKYMEVDSRTTQCFLNWLNLFAPFISPSKLRRVLKLKRYNPKWLGIFTLLLKNHPLNSQNWELLKPWISKPQKFAFTPNPSKYLKSTEYILKTCPELKFRTEGNNQVLSDLKAYLKKNRKFQSLYRIAKDTFNPKNRINYEYVLKNYLSH